MSEELILPGEFPQGEPPPTPEPEPQPETDVLIRFRGEDVPVPQAGLEALAAALKTTPERAATRLQTMMESNHAWNEAEKQKQRADALEQQWQEHLRRQPVQLFAPPQPQYVPPPAYPPPNGYPPQPYQQPGVQPDPIALIEATRAEVARMSQTMDQREKAWEQRRNEEAARQDAAQWESAADRFLADKNKGRKTPVRAEELLEEVRLSGMHLSNMAPERIFDKAWRVMTYDDAGQTATQDLMTRLRAPTAKVVIPGAPSNTPPPASKPKEPDFGGLLMKDIIENIPITRNL